MVPAAFIRFHFFRRANVRISEIRCTIKNVARTIYFILFHVRCADGITFQNLTNSTVVNSLFLASLKRFVSFRRRCKWMY